MKIQKNWWCRVGGQGRCEQRNEVLRKFKNFLFYFFIFFFFFGGGVRSEGGVRVDVNEELKFL